MINLYETIAKLNFLHDARMAFIKNFGNDDPTIAELEKKEKELLSKVNRDGAIILAFSQLVQEYRRKLDYDRDKQLLEIIEETAHEKELEGDNGSYCGYCSRRINEHSHDCRMKRARRILHELGTPLIRYTVSFERTQKGFPEVWKFEQLEFFEFTDFSETDMINFLKNSDAFEYRDIKILKSEILL